MGGVEATAPTQITKERLRIFCTPGRKGGRKELRKEERKEGRTEGRKDRRKGKG